jgi:hypothetical protein
MSSDLQLVQHPSPGFQKSTALNARRRDLPRKSDRCCVKYPLVTIIPPLVQETTCPLLGTQRSPSASCVLIPDSVAGAMCLGCGLQ